MNFRCSRLGGWAAAAAVTTRGFSDASRGFVRHPDAWNGIGLLLWVLSAWVAITGLINAHVTLRGAPAPSPR